MAVAGPGSRVDWRVAAQGALVTLAIALPPAVLVRILKGDDLEGSESYLWVVTMVAIFVGFGVGGHLAARRRPQMALAHAAAASALAFAGLAAYAVLRRVVTGDGLAFDLVVQLLLIGTITVSIGILGGYVATRRRPRSDEGASAAP